MQAMKLEKDNAMDRALQCEQQAKDANLRAEKAEEEARSLQKKIQTIENDLDQTQEQLTSVATKLEEKDKALQNQYDDCGPIRVRVPTDLSSQRAEPCPIDSGLPKSTT
ncbi:hypothetical protein WDU94_010118 [Cyamophila willieti]